MLVLNQIKGELENYLRKYDSKVASKYLKYYLKFYSEEVIENYFNKGRRKSYNKYLKYKEGCFIRVKDNEIYLNNQHQNYPRVNGRYFNSKTGRVRLYFQIKHDFLAIGYLLRTSTKQLFADPDTGVITSTREIFKVYLPDDLSYTIEDSDDELGDWDYGWDYNEYNGDYLIYYTDVLGLQSKLSSGHFIRAYSQFRNLKRSGFIIYTNQRESGDGYRIYHSFSFLNEELRALIRDAHSKELFISIDLVSSHLFFLAERSKNEHLYDDIKSRKIKEFDKKTLLMWLNSSNYQATRYGKINQYFREINLNTASLRDSKGLYNTLAKMESDYILRDISDRYCKLPQN